MTLSGRKITYTTLICLVLFATRMLSAFPSMKRRSEKYNSSFLASAADSSQGRKRANSSAQQEDPNYMLWDSQFKFVEKHSDTTIPLINEKYQAKQILCVNSNLDDILKSGHYLADYKTVVIVEIKKLTDTVPSNSAKLMEVIDHILNSGIRVEKFVFFNIYDENICKQTEYNYLKRVAIDVDFVDSGARVSEFLYAHFLGRFKTVNVTASYSRNLGTINELESEFVKGINTLKMDIENFLNISHAKIHQMKTLESLWIFADSTPSISSDVEKEASILVKNLYIETNLLRPYLDTNSILWNRIQATESITVLMGHKKADPFLEKDMKTLENFVFDFARVKNSVAISFGICSGNTLTPVIMDSILNLVCAWNINTHNIRVDNIVKEGDVVGITQMPLYYQTRTQEQHDKLKECSIIVSNGGESSDVKLAMMRDLETLKVSEMDTLIQNCTIIMDSITFNEFSKLPHLSSKITPPKCLKLLRENKIDKTEDCRYCDKSLGVVEFNYKEISPKLIMIFTCGHACCAPCGYEHVSKGFKSLPVCRECSTPIAETMMYVTYNELLKKFSKSELLESDIKSAFNSSKHGFVFSYGSSDSLILRELANTIKISEEEDFKWEKQNFESSYSYELSSRDNACKCVISNIPIKQMLEISLTVPLGPSTVKKAVIYIISKKKFLEKYKSPIYLEAARIKYGQILLKSERFLFLYKYQYISISNGAILEKITKNMGDKIDSINDLCGRFWDLNEWM
ncbi:hypothetical protein NEMIN01_1063 [Nematocida minor]|uniref:uncharacterized protein n=1 Tax=Nematocida minor TaxID=1912983 RepID=UPI0022211457|nr:uncharacterized protein NEMIN01_1063 [Nematocida minor]KAI5190525.1 hypothetical protein NEMIN01_1063 [Nematocida minor]